MTDYEEGRTPTVNVVFCVPGSLIQHEDVKTISAARFSRKENLLLVEVPVSREEAWKGGSVEFVIGALEEAIRIASKEFQRKRTAPFDTDGAQVLIGKARESLFEQGFR